jgi:hypothetical protein
MATTYKPPTRNSAISILKRFFGPYPDSDTLTPEQMYLAWSRPAGTNKEKRDKNKAWLSNKLTAIYTHKLAEATYIYDPHKKLKHIKLTNEGSIALGRYPEAGLPAQDKGHTSTPPKSELRQPADLTLDEMLEAVERLNAKHTTFEVKLTVIPREQPIEQG